MRQTPRSPHRMLPLALLAILLTALSLGACAPQTGSTSGAASTPTVGATASTTPTATPAAPMTPIEADLAARAQRAIGSLGRGVTASYDPVKKSATITVTVAGGIPFTDQQIAAAHNRTELITYWVMSSAWASGEPLNEVMTIVLGPIQDEYADIITDWYGVTVVEASTARDIAWASADPYAVWSRYDRAMLRPSFDLFD